MKTTNTEICCGYATENAPVSSHVCGLSDLTKIYQQSRHLKGLIEASIPPKPADRISYNMGNLKKNCYYLLSYPFPFSGFK